jgi:predicted TIM-barrel fold metal-dependent hydrolase
MKYLDFHQHYAFLQYGNTKIECEGSPDKKFEEIIIENCKNLDMVVVVNGLGCYPGKRNEWFFIDRNDDVEKFFRKYPDYIIGFAYIDLDYSNPENIDGFYKRGFKGIKTTWPSERYDSKKYFEIYKRCEYFGMPILFHTGVCYEQGFKEKEGACSFNMSPYFLEMIGVKIPGLKIVGAHLGSGEYDVACVIGWANNEANKNIKFDISSDDTGMNCIIERKYLKYIPVDGLIWGLDEPPCRYEEIINRWDKHFDDIGFSSEDKEKIFYKNSCKVLEIS